jgi:uncharacterized protein (DUF736 family)
MPEYDDTNRGAMFKNDRKETDRHPDMKGSLNVEGREYWVSAWKQVSKAGQGYVSLSITPKDDQPSSKPDPQARASRKPEYTQPPLGDNDIPF